MADWSELQPELLAIIVTHLILIEDYFNFRLVCKLWRSVATIDNFNGNLPRVPWLMLAEEEEDRTYRKFFSLYTGMILKRRIPGASGKGCMESKGWLVTVGKDQGEIRLLHPFSGVQIELPHQTTTRSYLNNHTGVPWTYIRKAVLSANPSHTSDYVLMVIEGRYELLSLWRPGDLLWTRIWMPAEIKHINDVVFFNGHFYAVTFGRWVQICDVVGSELINIYTIPWIASWKDGRNYIVESLGSLFVVAQQFVDLRYINDDRERIPLMHIPGEDDDGKISTHRTRKFRVFRIDFARGKATLTRDIGDQAFFWGSNASLSIQASQFPGIKPNCIYFTDSWLGAYNYFEKGCGLDMGVFNLADDSIQLHYDGVSVSRVCPPIWVTQIRVNGTCSRSNNIAVQSPL